MNFLVPRNGQEKNSRILLYKIRKLFDLVTTLFFSAMILKSLSKTKTEDIDISIPNFSL
uniref:Uncharacterized protein n=1 Tax=Octopus bimaculoides TaxID=37653 RepID=A0A0L8GT00_OCTBM